ncbi:DNA-directed RNA polymerases I and III subunit RPAC2-like [Lacerta agilis]|uniref:DNA-directed RNA polymerases I and III subunit RPAC2-like n=1 Tax=Lacerta agilis TaxID=80427 RepID=UPI00141A2FDE|nr:DNA-directed RNA polymerases I and III subunit RPAC2-like [Lacerta agilis]
MGDEEDEKKPLVLQMVRADGTDKNCFMFVLHNEDHTLGNSLQYMIMKNPDVEFCGYSITHPSERKINLRIQTKGGLPAVDMFQKGLEDLMGVCQHILSKFEASVEEYNAQKDVTMHSLEFQSAVQSWPQNLVCFGCLDGWPLQSVGWGV